MSTSLRPELKALPTRMQKLPIDERGYPVPWFVAWVDGKPEFRAMDGEKWIRAIKERRCWVCGETMGVNLCFVAGCMCGINRTSAEPPSHYECALWSAKNCPFLSHPDMVRREDSEINNEQLRQETAGFAIVRNPGVTMLWVCRGYEVFPDGKGGRLIMMGEPQRVEWYKEARTATREEVLHSINTGLPNLEAMAMQQEGAMQALITARQRFEKWLPTEKRSALVYGVNERAD